MSKLLTTLFAVLTLLGAAIVITEGAADGELARSMTILAPCALVLLALAATSRGGVPRTVRRGDHLAGRPVGVFRWLVALPWIAAGAVLWIVVALLSIVSMFSGSSIDPPDFSARRVARHAWRLWSVLAAALLGTVVTLENVGDSGLVVAAIGVVGLTAVRLATRWMDRADARSAPAAGPLSAPSADPAAPVLDPGAVAPREVTDPTKHSGPFL